MYTEYTHTQTSKGWNDWDHPALLHPPLDLWPPSLLSRLAHHVRRRLSSSFSLHCCFLLYLHHFRCELQFALSNVNLTFSLNWLHKLLPCWHPVCLFLLPFWTWTLVPGITCEFIDFNDKSCMNSAPECWEASQVDLKLSWKRLKKWVCFLIKFYQLWRLLVWFFNVHSVWPRRKQATYLISVFCAHNS